MDRKTYLSLIEPAIAVVASKHQDYNEGGVQLKDYFPFGHKSHVQMLHVKTMRLVSLATQAATPKHESVQDSVLDLINYAVFYLEYLRSQHPTTIGGAENVRV